MTTFLRPFAYVCIWSTPFQIGVCLWALGVVWSSDATILSLTNQIFLSEHFPALYRLMKAFTDLLLPQAFADFLWSLPIILHSLLKAVTSTWLGIWILRKLNAGHSTSAPSPTAGQE